MSRLFRILPFLGLSVAAGLVSLLSYEKWDRPVALFFARLIQSHPLLEKATTRIPDLLPALVVVTTAGLLLLLCFGRRGALSRHRPFFKVAAAAVPLAYLLKSLLQFIFGRVSTRQWLRDGGFMGFHWLSPFGDFRDFPSGHMTVATALLAVVWWFYPRLRPAVAAGLFLLAFALVATDYHFLSDVIAGTYAGLLPALAAKRLLPVSSLVPKPACC